ncbi:Family S9 non-peptidase ue (S09 family) [Fasciola hepatica]|uniref:Family S9 non-peptidase ue (S09 family) n=1 Tax=Fasciola hepatica TaxID=6192 RepID=A0A4E0RXC3_FASHE|nr:Family S9 non-peptidase ue (S09 family) [Fasciola hepatica]
MHQDDDHQSADDNNRLKLPSVVVETEYLYDTVNWLKNIKNPEERKLVRGKLAKILRDQSELCRQRAKIHNGVDLAVPYGQTHQDGHGLEAFDWFAPFRIPEKIQHVLVYIHGGYWRALDLPESSHWATAVTDFGGIFVGLAYRLAPYQPIQTMPQRICHGLQTVFEHSHKKISQKTKNTPNIHMHLVGHSAGAQLIIESVVHAIQLSKQQPEQPQQQQKEEQGDYQWLNSVRSLILLSGIYDLRPIISTSINQALKLENLHQAWQISPLRLFAEPDTTIRIPTSIRWLIAWAQFDSPAIIGQSSQLINFMRDYYGNEGDKSECKSKSCDGRVDSFCVTNEDHFSSIEKLHGGLKQSNFFKKMLQFIYVDSEDV